MEISTQGGPATIIDVQTTGVSWPAIVAGAVTAAALTLILVAFGAGLGLSAVSPWSGSGVSAGTFQVATGVYLLVVAVMASAIGGYVTARLRTRWAGLHTNEVFFRDTAHGLVTWAFATVLSAAVLGGVTARIAGVATGAAGGAAATQATPTALAVDNLFRPATGAAPAGGAASGSDPARGEVARLFAATLGSGGDLSAADRAYLAQVVAARTGMSQADAEKRVSDVIAQTKQALDNARRAAAKFSLWLAASLLLGAFAASLAAVEGGQLRDGTWNERKLTPRPI